MPRSEPIAARNKPARRLVSIGMDNEAPVDSLIGDETNAGVCADGVCAVPPVSQDSEPEATA